MPKAEELWCWHSVQWQIHSFRGLSVGVVNWILLHWQRAFIPILVLVVVLVSGNVMAWGLWWRSDHLRLVGLRGETYVRLKASTGLVTVQITENWKVRLFYAKQHVRSLIPLRFNT